MRLSYRHVSLLQAMLISELQLHDRQTGGLSRPCHKSGASSDFWFIENLKNKIGKSPKQQKLKHQQKTNNQNIRHQNKQQKATITQQQKQKHQTT